MAIPDYLDKHFKDKVARKREAQMMGTDFNASEKDDLVSKIMEWEDKE